MTKAVFSASDLSIVPEDAKYTCTAVPVEEISRIWHVVSPMLKPAIDRSHGRWSIEHLYHVLLIGGQTLWIAYDSAGKITGTMTTQIIKYPCNTMLAFQFLGGTDFDGWVAVLLPMVKCYARDNHCAGVEGTARFGFWPWLKEAGFNKSYAVYEQIFTGESHE